MSGEWLERSDQDFRDDYGFDKPGGYGIEGEKADEDQTKIVFLCKAGVRSRAAGIAAMEAGIPPQMVHNYEGGAMEWVQCKESRGEKEGLP